jgi:hypothetical protein
VSRRVDPVSPRLCALQKWRWSAARSREGDAESFAPSGWSAHYTLSVTHWRPRNASRFPHRSLTAPSPEGNFHEGDYPAVIKSW